MDLKDNIARLFYSKNLKIMNCLNRDIFTRPFLHDTHINPPHANPSTYHHAEKNKREILKFVAELEWNGKEDLERRLNMVFAKIFFCELALFIFRDTQNGSFYIRSVGENVLRKKSHFDSVFLNSARKGQPLQIDDFEENDLKGIIRMYYNKSISSTISAYINTETMEMRDPFFFVLFNKNVSLPEINIAPKIKIQAREIIKMVTHFSKEEIPFLRSTIEILYPIAIVSILDDSQPERMEFMADVAKHVLLGLEGEVNWLRTLAEMSKEFFEVERLGIYWIDRAKNEFEGRILSANCVEGPQIVRLQASYGMVSQIFDRNEAALFNDPPVEFFKDKCKVVDSENMIIRNYYCAPINIAGVIKGVIEVINKEGRIHYRDADNVRGVASLIALGML